MNTKQVQLTQLLLCLQRLQRIHNPNIDNGIPKDKKNVNLYKGVLGLKNTVPNFRWIATCIINKYNIKDSNLYMCSSCIPITSNSIQFVKQPQWQTCIFNPITPREYEKGIYTLRTKVPTNVINSFVIGLSNKKIPKHQNIHYYYISCNTCYMWLHLKKIHACTDETFLLDNYSLKINQKLNTNDTFTFDIFNRNEITPPKKIKNQYCPPTEYNWCSLNTRNYIEISNNYHTIVKIIYHSYEHTIQYYINNILLCTIPAEIDSENMYPFIAATSNNSTSIIEFM